MVAVPGLTFGNGALCLVCAVVAYRLFVVVSHRCPHVVMTMQRFGQVCYANASHEVKAASQHAHASSIGFAHGKTLTEGVQGDMGWSSFEAREANSKLEFEERLREMDEERWAGRISIVPVFEQLG
ncbi:unnamed protein product, partial [Ixodes pacificus]